MIYKRLTAALIVIVFSGCESADKPAYVLSEDEMTVMLTEFYLKEAKLTHLGIGSDSSLALFNYYKHKYAESKSLPDSVLDLSYQYYIDRPAEMSVIYDRVIDSLSLNEQRWRGTAEQ